MRNIFWGVIMSVNKVYQEYDSCPICGDPLLNVNGRLICKCCGFIAPYQYNFALLSQLEQAQILRKSNRFQDALEKYQEIILNEPTSLEANYGALLSEYGIEPVKDKDGTYKFTFHRFSYQSFFDTIYYTNINNYTYGEDNENYLEKIQELENIRVQINEEAKKAKKYDVFLCTKITRSDDPSKKTEEYLWAEDVYRKLKKMGLNVFFSPYSLPATLGSYEVAIFTALKSSKFMVIFASNEDNLNSPWPKNEWGRFLKFKKEGLDEDKDKQFKLIVKKDIKLNNADLSIQNYIKTIDKDWMDQLIESLSNVFPEILKSKEFVGGTIVDRTRPSDIPEITEEEYKIDLNDFKPKRTTSDEDDIFSGSHRPKKIHLTQFGDGFKPLETDEQECVDLMINYLKNGNFRGAKNILKDFRNYKGTQRISSKQLMLLMFAQSEARSIEEFKFDKVRNFKEYDHIITMMDTADKTDGEDLASIFSDFIIQTIRSEEYTQDDKNHALNLYKLLSKYDNTIITKLHNSVINSYRSLINNIDLLRQYLDVAFPILASTNYPEYLEKASIIAENLIRNSQFEYATQIADEILETDQNNPNALFVNIKAELKVTNIVDLLIEIENKYVHNKISEIFSHIDEADAKIYINQIINRIKKLLQNGEFNKVDEWMTVISGYNFEGREELISGIYKICMDPNHKDIIDLYDSIKKAALDKKTFITRTNKFADLILKEFDNYDKAKKYYLEVLNYDKSNRHALDGLLATQLQGRYQNIYMLTDFTTLERYITTRESDTEIFDYVANLCNHCIRYVKNCEINEQNNVFVVFDKLLTYIPNQYDDDLINIVKVMADTLLQKKLFDMSIWYNSIILGIDETYHKAYWSIMLAKCKVSNNEELKETNYNIYDLEEYKRAIHYAHNSSDLDMYTSIQIKAKKKKQKKNPKIFIIIGIAIVVIAAVLLLLLL